MTVLRQELAVLSKLQNLCVVCPVASDPDVALVVYGDPVIRLGPLVPLSRAAPVPDQIPGLIELENGRSLGAACAGLLVSRSFVSRDGIRSMNDPDVVLRI